MFFDNQRMWAVIALLATFSCALSARAQGGDPDDRRTLPNAVLARAELPTESEFEQVTPASGPRESRDVNEEQFDPTGMFFTSVSDPDPSPVTPTGFEWTETTTYQIRLHTLSPSLQTLDLDLSSDSLLAHVPQGLLRKLDDACIGYDLLGGHTHFVLRRNASEAHAGAMYERPSIGFPVGAGEASRESGTIELGSGTLDEYIPDDTGGWVGYRMRNQIAPSGSYVTNLEYRLRIDDEGDGNFYCADYEVWLLSGDWAWELLVYNHLGGATDGGYDDDSADDYDIYLNWRNTHHFDGEDPNQYWGTRVIDNWSSDDGQLNYIEFKVHWQYDPVLPDLIVNDVWISPTSPDAGQPYTIYAELCNTGSGDSPRLWLNYYVDGSYIDNDDCYWGLNPGECDNEDTGHNQPSSGWHEICVEIDPTNDIAESNEGNNTRCEDFYFDPPPCPDLVVDDIWLSPSDPDLCESFDINTRLCNIGDADSPRLWLNYYIDGGYVDNDDCYWGLNAGQCDDEAASTSVTSSGWHEICVEIDPSNDIAECNEGNNERCESFYWDPPSYAVYGTIHEFSGGADADGDGYYETFDFQVAIDGDVTQGCPTDVYAKMICTTTGQAWWSASSWTITGTATDWHYFAFDETDFAGHISGNTNLDFTVEIWNVSKTTKLATDTSVTGEPVKADTYVPPVYSVSGKIDNFIGGTDVDEDGYYETFDFRIGIDGNVDYGSAVIYGKMLCVTTGQAWWSSSPWTISGTATDWHYFAFDETDFAGEFTGNTDLDFTVEIWNESKTTPILATDTTVTGEPIHADDCVVVAQGEIPGASNTPSSVPTYLNNQTLYPVPGYVGGICWATATADILGYWDRNPYGGVVYWNLVDHGTAPLLQNALPTQPGHDEADVRTLVIDLGTRYYVNNQAEDSIIEAVCNTENGLSFNATYHGPVSSVSAREGYFGTVRGEIDSGRPCSAGSWGTYFGGAHQIPVIGYIQFSDGAESEIYIHRNTGGTGSEYANFFDPTWGNLDLDTIVPGGTPNDAYEDDDSQSAAKWIHPEDVYGFRQTHNFIDAFWAWDDDEVDWMRFSAAAGQRYTIETESLGDRCDTWLELSWDGGMFCLTDDNSGDEAGASRIVWSCYDDTTAYIAVTEKNGRIGHDTNYDVLVTHEPVVVPETPNPIAPTDGATITDLTPAFDWSAFQHGGDGETQTGFEVRVRSDTDGDTIVYDTGFISSTSGHSHTYNPGAFSGYDPTADVERASEPLEYDKHYHWHVRYRDSGGDWGGWSADDPNPHQDFYTEHPPVTISGHVLDVWDASGIDGVTMSFTGQGSTSTGASGYYSRSVPYGWSGTVTPGKNSWSFSPPSRPYSNVTSNQSGQDFQGTHDGVAISGYVTDTWDNGGMDGVNVAFSGQDSVTTSASGYFTKSLPYHWSGTVTPSKSGWSFEPPNRPYSDVTSDQSGQDFEGTHAPVTISGTVRDEWDNSGIEGATVAFSGQGSCTTNASGDYSKSVPYHWSGTATPTKSGWSFSPPSRPYSDLTSNQSGEDYQGTHENVAIAGYVTDGISGHGIGGVTLSFTGQGSTTTIASGYYSKSIPYHWTGTAEPSNAGWWFDPASRPYTNLTTDMLDENYEGVVCCCASPDDGVCCQLFGDLVGSGGSPNPGSNCGVDLFDIFCVLNGFAAGSTWADVCPEGDLVGSSPTACGGNGDIDIFDIFAVLNAFTYPWDPPCPHPCAPEDACESRGASTLAEGDRASGGANEIWLIETAELTLVATANRVRPGDAVVVDVYIDDVVDLRGYQIAIEATGGERGTLVLEQVSVETERGDYVFGDAEALSTTDEYSGRVANALIEDGVTVADGAYLATYIFRVSADALGVFEIVVRAEDTLLGDSADQPIGISAGSSARVKIHNRPFDRRRSLRD